MYNISACKVVINGGFNVFVIESIHESQYTSVLSCRFARVVVPADFALKLFNFHAEIEISPWCSAEPLRSVS